jgi:membrane protein implicated in regulation of membrane protease activity
MANSTARWLRGVTTLIVGVVALAATGYVSVTPGEFERPLLVAALLVVTALLAFWQARRHLRGTSGR